jgi:hypothetical protein
MKTLFFLAIGVSGTGFCGWRLYDGFRTGSILLKNESRASRTRHPIMFWTMAASYLFFILIALFVSTRAFAP